MWDFVPLFDVREMVHDANRKLLYVTATTGEDKPWSIQRYDLEKHELLPPFAIEGDLWGVAISPDRAHLVVADASGESTGRCHVIDLERGFLADAISTVEFDLEPQEGKAFMPLFLNDSAFVITTASTDPAPPDTLTVPLRKFELSTLKPGQLLDQAGKAVRVSPGTMLAKSGDGAYLVMAQADEPAQTDPPVGRLARYELATGKLERSFSNFNLGDISANHDGSLLAASSYLGLIVADENLGIRRGIERPWTSQTVSHVAYNPKRDVLYVTADFSPWGIEAYHMKTWQAVHVVESDSAVLSFWTNRTLGVGRMHVSDDGSLLFVHTHYGVGIYRVGGEGEQPDDTVHYLATPDPEEDTVHEVPKEASFSAVAPILDAWDAVYDEKRNTVYASTPHGGVYGSVMRWQLDGTSDPEPLELDGKYTSLDLSPNQDKLAIADGNAFMGHLRVQVVDLATEHNQALDLPWETLESAERSAHYVMFLDDDTLLVSSSVLRDAGQLVPLRRVDLRTGDVQVVRDVEPEAIFSRSADGSEVAVSWASFEARSIDHYYPARTPEQAYEVSVEEVRPYGVTLSRDGSQVAIPTKVGVLLYDAQGTLLDTIGPLQDPLELAYEPRPFSALYSPIADLLYVAWSAYAPPDEMPPSIDVYDSATFAQHAVVEAQKDLYSYGSGSDVPFGTGRMRASADGRRLLVIGPWGIAVYELSADGGPAPQRLGRW
jgi:hypothetical protein